MSTLTEQGDAKAAAKLHEAFEDCTQKPQEWQGDWRVEVTPERECEVLSYARDELGFDLFIDRLGADRGIDTEPRFEVITVLYNIASKTHLIVITAVPESAPELPTAVGVFRGANWFEREVWDMYGVRFLGHPRHKRILMPEVFPAHPLRKEYPMEGEGDWAAPRRALGGNVDGTEGKVAVPEHPGQPGPPTSDPGKNGPIFKEGSGEIIG